MREIRRVDSISGAFYFDAFAREIEDTDIVECFTEVRESHESSLERELL